MGRNGDFKSINLMKEAFLLNFRPIAVIDVGKFFNEMAILSPSNEVIARMKEGLQSYLVRILQAEVPEQT